MSSSNGSANGRRRPPEPPWDARATSDGVEVTLPGGVLVVLEGDSWRLLTPTEAMHLVSDQRLRDAIRRSSIGVRANVGE